jgi:hypothetical protein
MSLVSIRFRRIWGRACEATKVGRSSHYRWLKRDAEYREAFAVAKEEVADLLEAEAFRRAVEGVEKPVRDKELDDESPARSGSPKSTNHIRLGASPVLDTS